MTSTSHKPLDLLIVGAGPAGLSAAIVGARYGLHVLVLDEFPEPGGRMLGQFHEENGGWWVGKREAERLVAECKALGVDICCSLSVYGITRTDRHWIVRTTQGSKSAVNVLIATGAAEIPCPCPGWTLPGVMSIGAAQVMTNVHYVKPGERGLIIGANMLALAIARELAVSGVVLIGIVLPSPGPLAGADASPRQQLKRLLGLASLAPSTLLRIGGKLANSLGLAGVALRLLPRKGLNIWGVPLQLRTAAVSINGEQQVESVTLANLTHDGKMITGSEREVKVDFVALAGGLYPLAELAAVAGCPFDFAVELGGHIPLHDEQMRTPLEGLYVAGNITGIESAQVAMAQGRLAALSICGEMNRLGEYPDKLLQDGLADVRQVRASALIQFQPGISLAREQIYQKFRAFQETRV
ncbi:NAD(P)/FAD-dependent oxidoreductase [Paenibacillus sanguinis]|uniref:NAD(P)/FAD-dependent oxidoreductase n=1 Tax=Paenibacillus sanguinis TaxID=225906 RepID=UPI0003814BB1|nr:NAD(P)/FAD-dependent oxidoreductase [Paenibacillus sanguinis]